MAGTLSSTRDSGHSSGPTRADDAVAGTKRKAETKASPKHAKTAKKQATIEDMLVDKEKDNIKDTGTPDTFQDTSRETGSDKKATVALKETKAKSVKTTDDADKSAANGSSKVDLPSQDKAVNGTEDISTADESAVEQSSQREKVVPSNILEKGVIYFFTRNRVGIEDADSVGDLQRTYFVLRPIPTGAKLVDGILPDNENNRLLALPKKTFPKSHTDRFMAFVEKANTTIKDLKEAFFAANEYETKTMGTRRTEPVTPIAEGVYAITRTEDATSHLVYSTTIPSELGEVQEDLGIRSQGSFIISAKNPERSGPASAQLPQKPGFPKEVIKEFRNLAWSEVKPKYLDYEYCQILLIGEKFESAVEPTRKDQKHDKESPQEEIEKLEHEDELRIQHLHGDDSVYDDLKISKDEYAKVPTTW